MKKFTKTLIEILLLSLLMVTFIHFSAFAANLPNLGNAEDIYKANQIPTPSGGSGQEIVTDLVLGALVYVKFITVAVGILFLSIMGFKMVALGDNEEEVEKAKKGMIFAILAFIMISMSQDIAKIFDMRTSTVLGSPSEILKRFKLFDRQAEIGITFIKYVIGAFATLSIVRSGAKLITEGGEEESTTEHKKAIGYSLAGLVLINVGDIFINKVFYKIDKTAYTGITGVHPGVDAKEGVEQIVGITNLVVTFIGPVAVLALIAGAVMYATAGGQEEQMEKAKRLLIATVVGIVIIYGAFAIVSTIVSGKLNDVGALIQ
ncbi:hypothetical protein JKY72_04300 [Candidatus Gracilibacteria bacterium]|nr:hypothetical protein [Candidatus Gracilibacteria bacterium]